VDIGTVEILHDPARLASFVLFCAVVAGTPGPSNALLTAIGARVGVRRGLVSLLGQVTGMGTMLFAVIMGLGDLLLAHPLALQLLKWGSVALLGWMAWRIATAGPPGEAAGTTAGFLAMAAFQWVNPKGWLIGVAAIATFLNRHSGSALGQAGILAIVFALVALPACLPWLAFGATLKRFIRTRRAWRTLNGAMAVLLAASTIPLVLTGL
jgi:threonine/homoserine/homoserine lactone efflux protein